MCGNETLGTQSFMHHVPEHGGAGTACITSAAPPAALRPAAAAAYTGAQSRGNGLDQV